MLTVWIVSQVVLSVAMTSPETDATNAWAKAAFGTETSTAADIHPPFSFVLGDQPSSALLPTSNLKRSAKQTKEGSTVSTIT